MDIDSSGSSPDDALPPAPDTVDPTQADQAEPDPTQTTEPPRLGALPRRSSHDRYLGGVAAGIAERFGIDPFAPRAAFLGATLFAAYAADWVPVVPFIYTVLWLVLPGPTGHSVLGTIGDRSSVRQAVAAVATFVVIAVLLTRPIFGIALALAALAWVLLSDDGPRPLPPSGPPSERGDSDHGHNAAVGDATTSRPAVPQESSRFTRSSWGRTRRSERGEEMVSNFAARARKDRREPALWPLTLGLLAIIAIGGVMADAIMSQGLDPAVLVNLALIAVGGVVAVSAWRGRAMWTALLALALLPAWVGFSVADIGRFEGSGSGNYRPTEVPASGELAYENGYGSMTIDLRDLPLEDAENLSVKIGTTAGMVTVLAPFDTDLVVRSKVGFGTTEVQGNGLDFYEYDREPFLDRYMVRRYNAHGSGCISEYWSTWGLLVSQHQQAGIDLAGFSATDEADVDPILSAITNAGFDTPELVQEEFVPVPVPPRALGALRTVDEFGNEVPQAFAVPENGTMSVINEFEDGSLLVIDEFGNEYRVYPDSLALPAPAQQLVADRTWSYAADIYGEPCVAQPPSNNPAIIEIDATIGVGTLEVHRDEF